jgi:hypothetical protein
MLLFRGRPWLKKHLPVFLKEIFLQLINKDFWNYYP